MFGGALFASNYLLMDSASDTLLLLLFLDALAFLDFKLSRYRFFNNSMVINGNASNASNESNASNASNEI